MTPQITCCFSGHRPPRLPWGSQEDDPRCLELKDRLARALTEAYHEGYRHFLCGMAQGTDLYFCQAVLDLRRTHPEVTLEAAIPFTGQADRVQLGKDAFQCVDIAAIARPVAKATFCITDMTTGAARPCWTSATWRRWSSTPTPPAA